MIEMFHILRACLFLLKTLKYTNKKEKKKTKNNIEKSYSVFKLSLN